MASTTTMGGTTSLGGNGTTSSAWKRGLSAYEIYVQEGGRLSKSKWLESLKGSSVTIKSVVQNDDGSTTIVFSDAEGDHSVILPKGANGEQGVPGENGISPTISFEQLENGYNLIISDVDGEKTIFISNGEKGDNGTPVTLMCTRDGVVYWRYTENDNNWKELIDLGALADNKYEEAMNNHKNIVFVDELPDPETADPNIIYILREEDDG